MTDASNAPVPDPRPLVRAAFEAARKAGTRPDWFRMNRAVLKNRLLQLTDGRFQEQDYGSENFRVFIESIDDLVEPMAEDPKILVLKDPELLAGEAAESVGARVRPDLWRATMDYSGGRTWIWLPDSDQAVAVDEAPPTALVLPTISSQDMADWRHEFARSTIEAGLTEHDQRAVEEWAMEGLPTARLPGPLRGEWNGVLRTKAAGLLRTWFAEQKVTPPTDLLQSPPSESRSETEILRTYALRCVAAMTRSELETLQIPIGTAQRVSRHGD